VLVELHASGVNPSDVKKRAGSFPNLLDGGFVIPHSDGAGVIAAVGEGVSRDRVGERVWVYQAQYGRRFGTAAGLVCVDGSRAPRLPERASFEIGACLGIPAMTAHRCVFADGPLQGQRVLITGGAGRVGYYAIQWARQAGAWVVATASNDADSKACLEVGANAVVNHRADRWGQDVLGATEGKRIDRVVDVEFGANLGQVLECVRTGATIATYASVQEPEPKLPFFRMLYLDLTLRIVIVYAMPEDAKRAAISDLESALRDNRLRHRVVDVASLDEIAKSHELVEGGAIRGCVVVSIRQ
jgi:NADPH:quinone reductase-like Zn-dependent oxidoreductase